MRILERRSRRLTHAEFWLNSLYIKNKKGVIGVENDALRNILTGAAFGSTLTDLWKKRRYS